jgi:AcrR family transcriptional regulator
MSITDRKEREKQEMRKLIINAAMEMFAQEGYEKTSIRNIADKIEYSPATIYLYYKDKDELLYEVQREVFQLLYEALVADITAADPFDRLRQLLFSYINFGFNHPDLYDLMFILRSPMKAVEDDDDWANCAQAYQLLLTGIQECIDQLRYEDVGTAALAIWSCGHGLISLYIRERIKVAQIPEDQVKETILKTVETQLNLIRK